MARAPLADDESIDRAAAERQAHRALDSLYRRTEALLAPYSCAACGRCCKLAVTRYEPFLFPIERRFLERWLEKQGRSWPKARADGACPFQDEVSGKCTVYPARALGCRTYFCGKVRPSPPPNDPINALHAQLVKISDGVDEGASPTPITRLFD